MPVVRPPIRAVFIDLSGTLHIGATPTPRAATALSRLRASRVPFRLCTNNSKESAAALQARLRAIGFDLPHEGREVWTSLGAAKRFLREKGHTNPYLLLSDSAKEEFPATPSCPTMPFDSVVIGLAPSILTYTHLNKAFRILVGEHQPRRTVDAPKAPLIATHKARYFASEDGALSLGPGPFVTALEHASGTSATVVGKPSRPFFEVVIQSLLDTGDDVGNGVIAVIGDDVESDLGEGAIELGFWRVLVKTGKFRLGDENRPGTVTPDEVAETFADWVEDFLDQAG